MVSTTELMSFCTEDFRLKSCLIVGVERNAARNESCRVALGSVSQLRAFCRPLGCWAGEGPVNESALLPTS